MATNKNAFLRYKVLDTCFRNSGRRYFIEDLISECENVLLQMDSSSNGISRRQVFEDIRFMESQEGWSIELTRLRDGKRIFYRYTDISFSINDMPLNEFEIVQLQSVADTLSQFKGMPQFAWINELIPKLRQGIQSNVAEEAIIEFDTNEYLKGIDFLGALHNAIVYKKPLELDYKPFESDLPFTITLHPYFLKQFNNRWFLYGFNPEQQKYDWNLAIDRIVHFRETKGNFHKNDQISWNEYFDDIIGVTKPDKGRIENITLLFFGKTGHYMESKPLHGSQKMRWIDKDTLEIKLKLMINYELERLILSYAETVLVMSPPVLAALVSKRLHDAVQRYEKNE